jgi:hypothetical protein
MKEDALFDFDELMSDLLGRLEQDVLWQWMFLQVFEYGILPLHNITELEKLWMLAQLKNQGHIKARTFSELFEQVDKNKKNCTSSAKKLQLKQTLLLLSDLAFQRVSLASLEALALIRAVCVSKKLDLPSSAYFIKQEQSAILGELIKLERKENQKKQAQLQA